MNEKEFNKILNSSKQEFDKLCEASKIINRELNLTDLKNTLDLINRDLDKHKLILIEVMLGVMKSHPEYMNFELIHDMQNAIDTMIERLEK